MIKEDMVSHMTSAQTDSADTDVVFFDGVCNLCNGAVDFIIERDSEGGFRFSSLQSDYAQRTLPASDVVGELNSIVLSENGKLYRRSTAALRIARKLKGLWPMMYVFIVVPPPIRDLVYRLIATYRYSWFGRSESCRIPTPELQARFIE